MRRIFPFVSVFLLIAGPSPSRAGVPSPSLSIAPQHVLLVGTDAAGTADPAGSMTFHIKTLAGTPYHSCLIVIDLSQSPGVTLCTIQSDPAVIVDCPTRTARFFSDGQGNATVRIAGRVDRSVAGSQAPSCHIFADGVLIGPLVPVASPDEDGNGLGASDNSLWQQDFFSGQYWERSDFDGNGALGAADLSLWTTLFFANGSLRSCSGSACP